MNIRYIYIVVLLFVSGLSYSQTNKNDKSYKRMEGTIGKNIDVSANFIELFGNVSGNYQYKFERKTLNKVSTYYGKMIELEGEMYGKDSVRFKEAGSDDYTIKGVWGVDFFNGKWKIPGEDKYMDMLLKEYYPEGSLKFKVYYLQSEQKLVENRKDSPTAEIELILVYPSGNFSNTEVKNKITKAINENFFRKGMVSMQPELMLKNFENEYYKSYAENKSDWLKFGGGAWNWGLTKSMSIKFNSDYLLSIEFFKYAYTGGAHGIENYSYGIFDLSNGNTLDYKDIFTDSADSVLTELLTQAMKKQYKTKENASLTSVGFWSDTIVPNNNFYVTGNGIGFKYASYEIAPYSMGLPEVFITFDKLKGILRKNTPVYKLANK